MKRQKLPLDQLAFLAICIALSLVTKRVISPLTNILTDFIRIPGGGAATAFSLLFLLIGTARLHWPWAATAGGFVQSLLALALGMSTYQGAFAVLTYTLPGVVIDLFRRFCPHRGKTYFALCCAAANGLCALLTNLLVFRLQGIAFALWMLVACLTGIFAGFWGGVLFHRLERVFKSRRFAA